MRVELKGKGTPIPELALPAPGVATDLPPQAFLLEDGSSFVKADYAGLGYTNFDAWCIGAVGGRGGNRLFRPDGWLDFTQAYGGAGGGGGFHHVSGLLADLPDSCPIVVGQAGANGEDDSGHSPKLPETTGEGYFTDPLVLYQNPEWVPAQPGSDGGASSFGDICRASGGKGGEGVTQAFNIGSWDWPTEFPTGISFTDWLTFMLRVRVMPGSGGQGGSGDSLSAGGGGDGAYTEWEFVTDLRSVISPAWEGWGAISTRAVYIKPKDGSWDGVIGKGGGGGLGGWFSDLGGLIYKPATSEIFAGNGAKGAYWFRDTSVYGPGRVGYYETIPRRSPASGLTSVAARAPGSGGGARLSKLAAYGSQAPGANPNGAVFVRLTKVA